MGYVCQVPVTPPEQSPGHRLPEQISVKERAMACDWDPAVDAGRLASPREFLVPAH